MPLLHRRKRGNRADDASGKLQIDKWQQERERKQLQPRQLIQQRVQECVTHVMIQSPIFYLLSF